MRQVRQNVFETNSSSTHSICVTKNNILDNKVDEIYFRLDEFGWEYSILSTVDEKAAYLYTGLMSNEDYSLLDNVKKILDRNKIEYDFQDKDSTYYYVDHSYELCDFLNDVCNDEDKLMRYLFSSESFVITANDNDCYDIDICVDYEHDEYYKDN